MKTCFVISPIGNEASEVREHADDVFEYIIKPATERSGFRALRGDHESKPGVITEQMYDSILGDDLIVAVLTYFNPNVFYEIAIAEFRRSSADFADRKRPRRSLRHQGPTRSLL